MSDLGELIYFPVMAKGLQLACIAEMSGLPWTGFTVEESGPKSWAEIKDSGIAPFGQMPLLKTPDGLVLGQSVAIANYIAKMAGAALEGATDKDFALSQMCMAEAEDIYSMLGACELANWKTPEQRKAGADKAAALFKDGLAAHFANLEKLAKSDVSDEGKHSNCQFTSVRALPPAVWPLTCVRVLARSWTELQTHARALTDWHDCWRDLPLRHDSSGRPRWWLSHPGQHASHPRRIGARLPEAQGLV
jgi:glutathione S-transferase